jgi:hypothetical protein
MENILQHQGISIFIISLLTLDFKLYRSNANAADASNGAVLEAAIAGE